MQKPHECYHDNLCVDCDDNTCYNKGKAMADCPKRECDSEITYDCDNCNFMRKYQEQMRQEITKKIYPDAAFMLKPNGSGLSVDEYNTLCKIININNLPKGAIPLALPLQKGNNTYIIIGIIATDVFPVFNFGKDELKTILTHYIFDKNENGLCDFRNYKIQVQYKGSECHNE